MTATSSPASVPAEPAATGRVTRPKDPHYDVLERVKHPTNAAPGYEFLWRVRGENVAAPSRQAACDTVAAGEFGMFATVKHGEFKVDERVDPNATLIETLTAALVAQGLDPEAAASTARAAVPGPTS